MLTINSVQLNHLRAARYQNNLAQIKSELEQTYDSVVQAPANGTAPMFTAWFDDQLKQCSTFNIHKSKNINSFCLYAIHHYPDFPSSNAFQDCCIIMQDSALEEDAKLDKVNHRLLFIR